MNMLDECERALTMLDRSGDTTITWDETQDDAMEALIEQKMKAGVTFFILPQRKSNRGAAPKPKPFGVMAQTPQAAILPVSGAAPI